MKVKWLPSAEDDANAIVDYFDPINSRVATVVVLRIEQAIERLRTYPFSGRTGRVGETRELVVSRTPYIVVYSVERETMVVTRIIHSSLQWPPNEE